MLHRQALKEGPREEVTSGKAQPGTATSLYDVETNLDAERAPGGLIKGPIQQVETCRHNDGYVQGATLCQDHWLHAAVPSASWVFIAGQAVPGGSACPSPGLLLDRACSIVSALGW